ncbi:MAG: hypothetical protein ACI8P0_001937, partial [Planctomycetaceae bacterium]
KIAPMDTLEEKILQWSVDGVGVCPKARSQPECD